MKNHHLPRRGFTIVELLVTISILIVLAAIGFSVMGNVKGRAQSMKCLANLRNWSVTFAAYQTDNNGMLKAQNNYAAISHDPNSRGAYSTYWNTDEDLSLSQQLINRVCPVMGDANENNPSSNSSPGYAMNTNFNRLTTGDAVTLDPSRVKRPSSKIFFMDKTGVSGFIISNKSMLTSMTECIEKHGGKINAVFLDLHVGQVEAGDLEKNWNEYITLKDSEVY